MACWSRGDWPNTANALGWLPPWGKNEKADVVGEDDGYENEDIFFRDMRCRVCRGK
jgi:hypothetical protein